MITRTRYFVSAAVLVLVLGVGMSLVAYYVGLPSAFVPRAGTEDLQYVPRDASVVAYLNVRGVMRSELGQRVRHAAPFQTLGGRQREFEEATGINLETDIDRVVACLEADGANVPGAGMVLARGRFDVRKIEALMRGRGAWVEDYKGKRLIGGESVDGGNGESSAGGRADNREVMPAGSGRFAVAFIASDLVAVGRSNLVRRAIDLYAGGGESAVANEDLMRLSRPLDSGATAWAVGRFDLLRTDARLPDGIAAQLRPITWFSVSGRVDGGFRGVVRAETRDEEAANNLRDVVRGFLAFAKLQGGSKPAFQGLLQSLELGGTGKTVVLSFDVPVRLFDLLGATNPMQLEKR